MNHKLKAFIFILLLFIPTYLAVASYIGSQDASIEDSRAVVRMSILDPDGGTYVFTPNSEEEDAEQQNKEAAAEIAFLTSLNKNAVEQEAMPDAIADSRTFTVTYEGFNRSSVYEYYFTDDPGAAFFRDPDGVIYKITSEDAPSFLC